MAIRPNLSRAEFDALPDAIPKAEIYRAEGDGIRADVTSEGGFELANTQNLLASVSATRGERDNLDRQLRETQARFEGVDLEALRASDTRLQELLANGDPSETAAAQLKERERVLGEQFAQREATLGEQHSTALGERDGTIEGLRTALDEQHFVNESTAAILAVDPKAWVGPIQTALRGSMIVQRGEDNARSIEILDSKGNVRFETVEGEVQPMRLQTFVAELQQHPELGRAFSGGSASGSGASAQGGGGISPDGDNPFDRSSPAFSLSKQSELQRTNPQEAARLRSLAPTSTRRSLLGDRHPRAVRQVDRSQP